MAVKRGLAFGLTWLYVQNFGRNSGHMQTATVNLRACFPEMGEAERQQLLKKYFYTTKPHVILRVQE